MVLTNNKRLEDDWGFYIDIENYTVNTENIVEMDTIPDNDIYLDFGDEYMYEPKEHIDSKKITEVLIKITSSTIITIASISCIMYLIL